MTQSTLPHGRLTVYGNDKDGFYISAAIRAPFMDMFDVWNHFALFRTREMADSTVAKIKAVGKITCAHWVYTETSGWSGDRYTGEAVMIGWRAEEIKALKETKAANKARNKAKFKARKEAREARKEALAK